MSLSASVPSERPILLISYLDVVLVVLGAPILIAIGVSAAGYAIGGGAWIALRAVGAAIDRIPALHRDVRTDTGTKLGYMLSRLFVLALAVILARSGSGRDAGLTALLVIVFAFTIQLAISAANRPRRAR